MRRTGGGLPATLLVLAAPIGLAGPGGLAAQPVEGHAASGEAHACGDSLDVAALVRAHAGRYPGMQTADIYKLLHQAVLGSEHAVTDARAAREWIEREAARLEPGPVEPLVDPLGANGSVVRVHLRPFVAAGGDPDRLADAFVATASAVSRSNRDLACALETAVAGLAADGRTDMAAALDRFSAARAAEGYPAVHHSEEYARVYRPAYRVVAHDLVEGALEGTSVGTGHHDRRKGRSGWASETAS